MNTLYDVPAVRSACHTSVRSSAPSGDTVASATLKPTSRATSPNAASTATSNGGGANRCSPASTSYAASSISSPPSTASASRAGPLASAGMVNACQPR